ncbi:MAG: tRNA (N6-isopentenyl adenosine(37)-C2)-methylthiotransferase MiaB [Clostridia bacterium]
MSNREKIIISSVEMDKQKSYSETIKQINLDKFINMGRPMYAYADTYGCQQNVADTQKIMGMLTEMGYTICEDIKKADIIVVNTCAVREHAEEKVLGIIGEYKRLKEANPNLIVALCGCMVQQEHMVERIRKSYKHVDLLFGTNASWRFPELLLKTMSDKNRVFDIGGEDAVVEGTPILRDGKVKAFLSIMYGCNNFCTYCIVPYVRGRERSREANDILQEFKGLIADGYKDITLLGQNVNSYGKDLENSIDFADLLELLAQVGGEFKIRFMTSHPKDATFKMIDVMKKYENIANQLHLPFQSGDNRVLSAMNRGYTWEKYLEMMEYAKKQIPDLVVTSDVIVGFPGETDEEFENTLNLVEKVNFNALFTFIYSKRSGTPAATMEDFATKEQKQVRFDKLLELQNNIALRHNLDTIGKEMRVLIEDKSRNKEFPYAGRTEGGRLVNVAGATDDDIGNYANIKVLDANMRSMSGKIIK